MRKTLITLALAGLFTGVGAAPAVAKPIPTSSCELQAFLGVQNVKECETSS